MCETNFELINQKDFDHFLSIGVKEVNSESGIINLRTVIQVNTSDATDFAARLEIHLEDKNENDVYDLLKVLIHGHECLKTFPQ